MPKPTFLDNVDYSALTPAEKRIKASRELFTIFYLEKNRGLTDIEIHKCAEKLKFTGYDGFAPDSIVRSNIYRWNDMVITAVTKGTRCDFEKCKKICSWGYEPDKPSRCERHKKEDMRRVVEERLVKHKKEHGCSKGKYYFDPVFARRVFPNMVPKTQRSDYIRTEHKILHDTDAKVKLEVTDEPAKQTFSLNNSLIQKPIGEQEQLLSTKVENIPTTDDYYKLHMPINFDMDNFLGEIKSEIELNNIPTMNNNFGTNMYTTEPYTNDFSASGQHFASENNLFPPITDNLSNSDFLVDFDQLFDSSELSLFDSNIIGNLDFDNENNGIHGDMHMDYNYLLNDNSVKDSEQHCLSETIDPSSTNILNVIENNSIYNKDLNDILGQNLENTDNTVSYDDDEFFDNLMKSLNDPLSNFQIPLVGNALVNADDDLAMLLKGQ